MDITLLYGRRELHPIIDQSAKIPPCVHYCQQWKWVIMCVV